MKNPFARLLHRHGPRLRHGLPGLCLLLLGVCAACSEETETFYATTPAYFRFQPVTAAQPLYVALNSPGMFCTITFTPTHYVFTGPAGESSNFPRLASEAYGKPYYISGFIVGTPAIPDMQGNLTYVAYDLVCPNCDTDDHITSTLAFSSGTTMKCKRCQRTYDLNNSGMVSAGGGGRSLYRYRMTYSMTQDLVLISN